MRRGSALGFTYLGVLLAVALVSLGLAAASTVWVTVGHRQRLAQLDWIGGQFERAIASYYESSPGGTKRYPPSLESLLHDPRYPVPRRHLRTIYENPFTASTAWNVLRSSDGGIRAVCIDVAGVEGWPPTRMAFGYVPGVAVEHGDRGRARAVLGALCPAHAA